MTKKKLIAVVGATAVGKTALCVRLAQRLNTVVISADSRQLFKEMRIGTAKPTPDEMQNILHYFIDSHSIATPYNVGNYEQDALKIIEQELQNKENIILSGGSGLYVRVVCEGIDEIPAVLPEIREQLNKEFFKYGLEPFLEQLKTADPVYYAQVDKANPQRIIRALEVILSTQQPFSSFRKGQKTIRPFEVVKIGLQRPRQELYDRIDQRMENMLSEGLFEEVEKLYPFRSHNALQTVGYKEIFDFIEKKYNWKECVRLLKQNSRHYAKRQLTWFNKDKEITWFHADAYDEIVDFIQPDLQAL